MLLTPTEAPPTGEGWIHEAKLDGWRCQAEVIERRVRLWSRDGHDWADRLPELLPLRDLRDLVLDGELVVATPDGRADFELPGGRMQQRTHFTHRVSYYAFDLLRRGERELVNQTWTIRRDLLDGLDLTAISEGEVRPTLWSTDAPARHEATAASRAEGTVSKRERSLYRPGRSRHWLKAKHKITEILAVAERRPSTASRPARADPGRRGQFVGSPRLPSPKPNVMPCSSPSGATDAATRRERSRSPRMR
jgi:bifunctional non-homologous end joining protein LigD